MKDKKVKSNFIFLLIVVLIAFIFVACNTSEEISTIETSSEENRVIPDPLIDNEMIQKEIPTIIEENNLITNTSYDIKESPYKDLFSRNNDYIGWISIEDTNINLPIVKGDDNDEYLRRNFDYEYDQKGSIFMDYRNFGFAYSKNTILYGHNLKDNSMFGDLKYYSDSSFALDHKFIEITDLYGTRKYQVFSSYFEKADSTLITTDFNDDTLSSYISTISDLSVVDYDLSATLDNNILTLVTCSYELDDGRFYVHAVEIID